MVTVHHACSVPQERRSGSFDFSRCNRMEQCAGIAYVVKLLATACMGLGLNRAGGEIFRTHPDRAWGLLSVLYSGYRVSFLGVKLRRRGVDDPPPSIAEVKRVKLYFYCNFGSSYPVQGRILLLLCLNLI